MELTEKEFVRSEMGRIIEIKIINITDDSLEEVIRKVKQLHWMGYIIDYDETSELLIGYKPHSRKRVETR